MYTQPRFFLVLLSIGLWVTIANAKCWPPLNGTSQTQENPVWVGNYQFGSGAYAYFVGLYRVDSLHCSESINEGPRGWSIVVESGRVVVSGEPEGTQHGPLPAPSQTLPPLRPLALGAAPQLPALPSTPQLKTLQPLPPVSGALPALSNVPTLPPLR